MHLLRYTFALALLAALALPAQAQLVRSPVVEKALANATSLPPEGAPGASSIVEVSGGGGLDPTFAYGDYNSTGTDNDVFGYYTAADLEIETIGDSPETELGTPLPVSGTFGPDNAFFYAVLLIGEGDDAVYYLAAVDPLNPDNGYEIIDAITYGPNIFGSPVGIQYDAATDSAVLFTVACGNLDDEDETYVQSYVGTIDLETAEVELLAELRDPEATGTEDDFGVCIVGVSWDPGANVVFASDLVGDDIVKVDVSTGELIERSRYAEDAPILADVAFVQDAAWDPNTQRHYVVPFSVDRDLEDNVTAIASPMYECVSDGGCTPIGDLANEGGWVEPLAMAFPDLVNVAAEDDGALPRQVALGQSYPNPFAEAATIPFTVREASDVTITVHDVLGRQVRRVAAGTYAPGPHAVELSGAALPSGIYTYRLEAGDDVQVRKMVLLK